MPRKIRCTVEIDHRPRGTGLYRGSDARETGARVSARPVPASDGGRLRSGRFLAGVARVLHCQFAARPRAASAFATRSRAAIRSKMEQALKVGGEVWIKLPYGDFVIDDARATRC